LGRSSRKWVTYPVKEQENGQMDAPRRCTAELTGMIQVGLSFDDAGDLADLLDRLVDEQSASTSAAWPHRFAGGQRKWAHAI
jgi:hypothetical protein